MSALDLIIARGFGPEVQQMGTLYGDEKNRQQNINQVRQIGDSRLQSEQQDRQFQIEDRQREEASAQARQAKLAELSQRVERLHQMDPNSPEAHQESLAIASDLALATGDAKGLASIINPKPQGPSSNLGKLAADRKAGLISPEDYDAAVRKATTIPAPASTTVRVDMGKAQTAGEVALAEMDAKDFAAVRTGATAASEELAQIDAIRANPAITGPTQDIRATGVALLSDLGIPFNEKALNQVANLASYKAAVGGLVLRVLQDQKGPQTEGDAQRAASTYAKIDNIPQANKFILDYKAALLHRKMEQANFAEEYRARNGNIDGWQSEWRKHIGNTPLFRPGKAGGAVFVDDFIAKMQAAHPEATREQILDEWRKAGR